MASDREGFGNSTHKLGFSDILGVYSQNNMDDIKAYSGLLVAKKGDIGYMMIYDFGVSENEDRHLAPLHGLFNFTHDETD